MEYCVIAAMDRVELERLVRGFIANGWKPQGGVSAMHDPMGRTWAQAMVKEAA